MLSQFRQEHIPEYHNPRHVKTICERFANCFFAERSISFQKSSTASYDMLKISRFKVWALQNGKQTNQETVNHVHDEIQVHDVPEYSWLKRGTASEGWAGETGRSGTKMANAMANLQSLNNFDLRG